MANATGGTGNGSNPAWVFKIGDWVTMPSRPKYGRGQVRSKKNGTNHAVYVCYDRE